MAMHMYAANASMADRFFYDADGELLIVPQLGTLRVRTELGMLECGAWRDLRHSARDQLPRRASGRRGARHLCENYGPHFRLPELGPIGTNGLANSRDFLTPVAAFEDREGDFRLVAKFLGGIWEAEIDHSPLDVVAWHGNYAPYKYDLDTLQLHQHGYLTIIPIRPSTACWPRPRRFRARRTSSSA